MMSATAGAGAGAAAEEEDEPSSSHGDNESFASAEMRHQEQPQRPQRHPQQQQETTQQQQKREERSNNNKPSPIRRSKSDRGGGAAAALRNRPDDLIQAQQQQQPQQPDGIMRTTTRRQLSAGSSHHPKRKSLQRLLQTTTTTPTTTRTQTNNKRGGRAGQKEYDTAMAMINSYTSSDDDEDDDTGGGDAARHSSVFPTASFSPPARGGRRTLRGGAPAAAVAADERLMMMDDSGSVASGNWSLDDGSDPTNNNSARATNSASNAKNNSNNNSNNNNSNGSTGAPAMTLADIAMCQALDLEYERALEDRQVAWSARYQSVRQSTFFSVIFMVLLVLTGTAFFLRQADSYWSVSEGLLFTIYTVTTVGYGHLETPSTPAFQLYTVCFIFLGIAMLTILVAQVYQCVALEANRVASSAPQNRGRRNGMRLWLEARMREQRASNNMQRQQQQQQQQQSQHATGDLSPSSHHGRPYYGVNEGDEHHHLPQWDWADFMEWFLQKWDRMRTFLKENEFGRGLSVILPFATLIAIGAAVIGPLEGWTGVEAIYFAVVSLTTVGFGDYYPTRPMSIWFCCLWLPFSVGFMSLYLANVAAFYIRLSDRNVARIERVLRRRLQRAKDRAEQERRAVLRRALRGQGRGAAAAAGSAAASQGSGSQISDEDVALATEAAETGNTVGDAAAIEEGVTVVTVDHGKEGLRQAVSRMRGFDTVPTLADDESNSEFPGDQPIGSATIPVEGRAVAGSARHLFGTEGSTSHRRERILQNSIKHTEFEMYGKKKESRIPTTMATMKDVLRTVHRNNVIDPAAIINNQEPSNIQFRAPGPESEFLSVHSSQTVLQHDRRTVRKKPSFALRALVQERFAEIIATDIAGYQSNIEIKDYTLAVTIQSLKQTADKWLVPRRARRAFRAVAFEALYFVGEHGLITRGADALFSLTPFEFHQIFSPLLAALGDAETMQLWLAHTQALAEVDLVGSPSTTAAAAAAASSAGVPWTATTVAEHADAERRDGKQPPAPARKPPPPHRPPPPPPVIAAAETVTTEEMSPGSSTTSSIKEQELPEIS